MPRALKWAAAGVASILLLGLLLAIAFKLVFDTEAGTRWAIERANAFLPGTIQASGFTGTLWGGLDFPRIRYADSDRNIEIVKLRLRIDWFTLAAGRLTLNLVDADLISYQDLAAPATPTPIELSMPALPIDVSIAGANVRNIAWRRREQSREILDITIRNATIERQTARAGILSATSQGLLLTATNIRTSIAGDVPIRAEISWELTNEPWSGDGTLRGTLADLEIQQSIAGPYPARISASVNILHLLEPEFDVDIGWERWSFDDTVLNNGSVQIRGVVGDYAGEYAAVVVLPGDYQVVVSGAALGDIERLTSFDARLSHSAANADLSGSLGWAPRFAAQAQVRSSNIDPAAFAAELSGTLDADALVRIDDDNRVSIENLSVSGSLNGQSTQAAGNIRIAAQTILCGACVIEVGRNRLTLDGESAGDEVSLDISVDAPALAQLWPGLSGAANGKGKLSGPTSSPRFSGDLFARQLAFEEWTVAELRLRSRESALEVFDIAATLESLGYGDDVLGSLTVAGKGQMTNLLVDLDWTIDGFTVSAGGAVNRADGVIDATVKNALVNEAITGDSRLTNPFDVRLAAGDVSVTAHTWSGDSGEVQISRFAAQAGSAALAANVIDLPLQLADRWLPENLGLTGTASADVDVMQQAGEWTGTVDWRQSETVLRVTEINDQVTNIIVPRAELNARLRDGGVVAKAWMSVDPGIDGELELEVSRFAADAPLVARLQMQGEEWGWISAVIPQVDEFRGTINADIKATGPLNAPELVGDFTWHEGQLLVPALNVPLKNVEVVISGASAGTATLTGSADAGDGTLTINGRFNDLMRNTRTLRVSVTGKAAEMINWPEYQLWATPNLDFEGHSNGWRFSGDIDVPRANIVMPELPVEAVRVSPDVSILGDEESDARTTRVSGEARLTLGNQVHVSALGLDTGLQGNLLWRMSEDTAAVAEGRVTLINGVFAAYGQKLTIQEGTLIFTGPLDDPLVDVKAVRVIETFEGPVTAGIHLRGRAQNLTSTVFSEPTMAEADALSYLVIGRPLSQATESEGGELSGAALALGLRQATRLTEQIGQTVGLDQLSLTGDGGDSTALVAGKQINSRLYARYAYGVFSRLGTLLLRYKLSRGLTLEAGAGENQSIDVLYSVEKP